MTAKDASDSLRQNRAASWTAGAMGLVLIAASAPFTVALWDEGTDPLAWNVAWDPVPAGNDARASLSGTGQAETELNVTGIPGSVVVDVACTDVPIAGPLGGQGTPVQMEVVLYEGETEMERRTGTCAELNGEPWNVTLEHPDLDEVSGMEREDAEEALAERVAQENRSTLYRVTVLAERPSSTPVPVPVGSFNADVRLSATVWEASVVDRETEVVR